MDWYTLRVISGKGKKIKENILFDVAENNMKELITDVLVPSENIVEMRGGKKKIRERVFFPRIFINSFRSNKRN